MSFVISASKVRYIGRVNINTPSGKISYVRWSFIMANGYCMHYVVSFNWKLFGHANAVFISSIETKILTFET